MSLRYLEISNSIYRWSRKRETEVWRFPAGVRSFHHELSWLNLSFVLASSWFRQLLAGAGVEHDILIFKDGHGVMLVTIFEIILLVEFRLKPIMQEFINQQVSLLFLNLRHFLSI